MIEAEQLQKRFGPLEAVRGVTFAVAAGEVVGLLGPNGAGKTTTMRMLTTFIRPTSGRAVVAGYDIQREPEKVRRNIGYLPEQPPLYPELTVVEYLSFVARIKGLARRELRDAVAGAVERCGLGTVRQRVCGQLSRGYRQRVGLAQAIVHKPKVIILDEPTSGLDPTQIVEIRRLIMELGASHTVILSTHILSEVTEICRRAVIIARGQVVAQGTVEELTRDRSLEQRFIEAVT